jgi:G3E family GTPase
MIDRLPVTVLSGYVGAGKGQANREGRKVAVIVSDMSEVSIDASRDGLLPVGVAHCFR